MGIQTQFRKRMFQSCPIFVYSKHHKHKGDKQVNHGTCVLSYFSSLVIRKRPDHSIMDNLQLIPTGVVAHLCCSEGFWSTSWGYHWEQFPHCLSSVQGSPSLIMAFLPKLTVFCYLSFPLSFPVICWSSSSQLVLSLSSYLLFFLALSLVFSSHFLFLSLKQSFFL